MAGVSGRSRSRVSWGEQEEHRREEKEGRRERRTALWAWREREGVTRVTSGWEGEERREEVYTTKLTSLITFFKREIAYYIPP